MGRVAGSEGRVYREKCAATTEYDYTARSALSGKVALSGRVLVLSPRPSHLGRRRGPQNPTLNRLGSQIWGCYDYWEFCRKWDGSAHRFAYLSVAQGAPGVNVESVHFSVPIRILKFLENYTAFF